MPGPVTTDTQDLPPTRTPEQAVFVAAAPITAVSPAELAELDRVWDLFSSFHDDHSSTRNGPAPPSIAECAAHLELLEVFVNEREHFCTWAYQTLHLLAGEAWDLYCRLAISRFQQWVDGLRGVPGEAAQLPPLDVLMVWHAFMLNPVVYLRFVELGGDLGVKGFDWHALHCRVNRQFAMYIYHSRYAAQAESFGIYRILRRLFFQAWCDGTMESVTDAARVMPTDCVKLASGRDFPVDLLGACKRQMMFAEHMSRYAWESGLTAKATLARAIERYEKFFDLLSSSRSTVMIPALDVDLVWHTHQLTPSRYKAFSEAITGGRLVDHDDNINAALLDVASSGMRSLWFERFGEEYHICLCWNCEASRGPGSTDLGDVTNDDVATHLKEKERRRRRIGMRSVVLDLASPRCGSCGKHPLSGCRPGAEGPLANCGSNCGSCPA